LIVNPFIFPSNGLMYDLKDSWRESSIGFFKLISVYPIVAKVEDAADLRRPRVKL